jgi:hypothetical protein
MPVHDSFGETGSDTIATRNTARIIDVVAASVVSNNSSGHAVWLAMGSGETTSAREDFYPRPSPTKLRALYNIK